MSIFNDNSIICVCCKERIQKYDIETYVNNIGICSQCFEKLEPVPINNPMQGRKFVNYVITGYYYNDIIKTLIHRYKFGSEYAFSKLFASILFERIKNIPELYSFDFITSIPLSRLRFLERGYNQSELIARELSKLLNIRYEICVHKKRHTKAQSSLKTKNRFTNIKNAFIADSKRVENKRILLFDDLFTTGSTMNECAKELISKGARNVAGIALSTTRPKITSEALKILDSGF